MLTYFPGRTIANLDARKQAITVRNLAAAKPSGLLPPATALALPAQQDHQPGDNAGYDGRYM
jgi:hypothetical protein